VAEGKFRYEVHTERPNSIRAAKLGLKNRLYVSGWQLSYELRGLILRPGGKMIVLAYKEDLPIGILFGKRSGLVMVFVRKAERRQGIGTQLYCEAAKILKTKIWNDEGIEDSDVFFANAKEKAFGPHWRKELRRL